MAKFVPSLCITTTKVQLDRMIFPGSGHTSAGGCGVPPTPKGWITFCLYLINFDVKILFKFIN